MCALWRFREQSVPIFCVARATPHQENHHRRHPQAHPDSQGNMGHGCWVASEVSQHRRKPLVGVPLVKQPEIWGSLNLADTWGLLWNHLTPDAPLANALGCTAGQTQFTLAASLWCLGERQSTVLGFQGALALLLNPNIFVSYTWNTPINTVFSANLQGF